MFCSQCGKQNPDTAKFCPACGANLQGGAPADKLKSSPALKIAIAGGIVAVAAAAGYVMLTPAPVERPVPEPPKPAAEVKAPEPKGPEKPLDPAPALAEPKPPAPDASEIAAAHKALDQKIADEEAAAKSRAEKK